MRTLRKTLVVLATVLLILVVFSTRSNAITKAELQEHMCTEKNFSGTKLIIRDSDKAKIESFFNKTDITDEQANKIKGYIDEAIAYMNADGAKSPNQMSSKEKKKALLQYAIDAAELVNLTVSYDASEERLDFYNANGEFIDSLFWGVKVASGTETAEPSSETEVTEPSPGTETVEPTYGTETTEPSLIQTGSTNYIYVAISGIVLVAGITLIISRKNSLGV